MPPATLEPAGSLLGGHEPLGPMFAGLAVEATFGFRQQSRGFAFRLAHQKPAGASRPVPLITAIDGSKRIQNARYTYA